MLSVPRFSSVRRAGVGVCALLAAVLLTLAGAGAPSLPPAAALPASLSDDALPAVFATGGTSHYRDTIQWLQWASYDKDFKGRDRPNVPVLDYGQSKVFVNYRDMGDAGYLFTTCTLSDLQHLGHASNFPADLAKGPLVATRPGTWAGDVLDNLYNIGGAADWSDGSKVWHTGLRYPADYRNNNQMVIGLANGYAYNGDKTWDGKDKNDANADRTPTGGYSRISFDMSCSAKIVASDGTETPVALHGLVLADAEASNPAPKGVTDPYAGEWIQATVPADQDVTWRLLDGMRSEHCKDTRAGKSTQVTTVGTLSDNDRTLRLDNTGSECVYQDGGGYSRPNGLGGPAVSVFMQGATKATITMQGSGYSAVALGLVIATDYGDAPASYGSASALIQPTWEGGQITRSNSADLFDSSVIERTRMSVSGPRLGSLLDSEGYQFYSTGADGDDVNGPTDPVVSDEDGVSPPPDGYSTAPGAVVEQTVTCQGQGVIAGWVDWNHNQVFDDAEKSDEQPCSAGGATLRWTVPDDVVRSVDGETSSQPDTYLRVRISDDGQPLRPQGVTMSGEVEDYKVAVRVPTIELVKTVEAPYATAEVPALDASQWSLQASDGSTAPPGLVRGDGAAPVTVVRPGGYTLSESSASPEADGYQAGAWECAQTPGTLDAPGAPYSSTVSGTTLTVANQDRVTCRVVNTSKPATLTWHKVDQDGTTPLGGTSWTLTGPGVPGGTVVADCTGAPCATGTFADTDPAPGAFRLTGLSWGLYTVTESAAPAGYQVLTQTLCLDLAAPGTGPKGVDWSAHPGCRAPGAGTRTSLEVGLQDTYGDDGSPTDVVRDGNVRNTRLPGSVTWGKADEGGAPLTGSAWTLTGPSGTGLQAVVEDCVADSADRCPASAQGTYRDSDPRAGFLKVTDLPWGDGDYTLVEARPPAGYSLDTTVHTFAIRADALDYSFDTPFTNTKSGVPSIPLTGGRGAYLFLAAGGVLLCVALAAGLIRRYRSHTH